MPLRFRRTINLFPGVKVNLSKGGMSLTVGKQGASVNISKQGVRRTVGIPGTGLSDTSYVIKTDADGDDDNGTEKKAKSTQREKDEEEKETKKRPKKTRSQRDTDEDSDEREVGYVPWSYFLLAGILIAGYALADAVGWIPPNFLSNLFQGLTQWLRSLGF